MQNRIIHIIIPTIVALLFATVVGCMVWNSTSIAIATHPTMVVGWELPQIESTYTALLLNNLFVILAAILLTFIASHYRLVKETSLLPMMFFTLFQLLSPSLINQYETANITTIVVLFLISILYTCYQENHTTNKGFLIALLLSIISFIEPHILYLLPIFILGFVQMQAASLRTFAAMIIGLITPYWIICGWGILEWDQLNFDSLSISMQWPPIGLYLLPIAAVILLGFVSGTSNLYNALNEKIHTRATNGFINILSIYITLLMLIDNAHYNFYLPILNSCVALQLTFTFSINTKRMSRILFYMLAILLTAWVIWTYWVS